MCRPRRHYLVGRAACPLACALLAPSASAARAARLRGGRERQEGADGAVDARRGDAKAAAALGWELSRARRGGRGAWAAQGAQPAWESENASGRVAFAVFSVLFATSSLCLVYQLTSTVGSYRSFVNSKAVEADGDDDRLSFLTFVKYQLGNWFTYSQGPSIKVLLGILICILLCGSLVYFIIVTGDMGASLYQIFLWLIAPNGGENQPTRRGALIGGVVSVLGLIVFALLMTVLDHSFHRFLEGLKEGTAPVLESGHVLILGFTMDTIPLVGELCEIHESRGGATIVILSPQPKPEVEQRLSDAALLNGPSLKGSRVLVRCGLPSRVADLKLVSADLCKTAIPMSDVSVRKELRDAYMLQVLAALRSKKWPLSGTILAFYSVMGNVPYFDRLSQEGVIIQVNLDSLVCSLCVSSSRQPLVAALIAHLLDSEGSELYLTKPPKSLIGATFRELSLRYPQCVIIGQMSEDDIEFCPDMGDRLLEGWSIIVLAESESGLEPSLKNATTRFNSASSQLFDASVTFQRQIRARESEAESERSEPEVVFLIGWSFLVGSLLIELDRVLPPGSVVASFAISSYQDRIAYCRKSLKRHKLPEYRNIQLAFYQGQPGSISQLAATRGRGTGRRWSGKHAVKVDGVPWGDIARVVILADESEREAWRSDAVCMTAAMQIQGLIEDSQHDMHVKEVPVVVELRDPQNIEVCRTIGLPSVICPAKLTAQAMGYLSLQPNLSNVFLQLFASNDYSMCIKPITSFVSPDQLPIYISFSEIQEIVGADGTDCLIGWDCDAHDDGDGAAEKSEAELTDSARSRPSLTASARGAPSRPGSFSTGPACTRLYAAESEFFINPCDKLDKHFVCERAQLVVVSRMFDKEVGTRASSGRFRPFGEELGVEDDIEEVSNEDNSHVFDGARCPLGWGDRGSEIEPLSLSGVHTAGVEHCPQRW